MKLAMNAIEQDEKQHCIIFSALLGGLEWVSSAGWTGQAGWNDGAIGLVGLAGLPRLAGCVGLS